MNIAAICFQVFSDFEPDNPVLGQGWKHIENSKNDGLSHLKGGWSELESGVQKMYIVIVNDC